MASALEEVLIASALETLDINSYWPEFDSSKELDCWDEDLDGEYPVILLFYETLLDDMLNCSLVSKGSVQKSIKHLVANYGRTNKGKTPEDLDYNDLNNCFGYLHRYASCHTALVRNVLKRVFHFSPPAPVKKLLCLKDSLEIVSLGGGPGNDLVGFCSALHGKHYGFLNVNFTVVDHMVGWERVFFRTRRMLEDQDFGNASVVFKYVHTQTFFIEADLTQSPSWNNDLRTKLQCADILLLVKVLSVIPDTEKTQLLQGIVSLMKPGALLIYIDCPFPSTSFATVTQWLDCVYESDKKKFQFDYEVKRFEYSNITSCKAHVRIYMKKFFIAGS